MFVSLTADVRTFAALCLLHSSTRARVSTAIQIDTLCFVTLVCVYVYVLAQGEVLTFCKDYRQPTESHTISTNTQPGGAFSRQQLFHKPHPHEKGYMTSWDKTHYNLSLGISVNASWDLFLGCSHSKLKLLEEILDNFSFLKISLLLLSELHLKKSAKNNIVAACLVLLSCSPTASCFVMCIQRFNEYCSMFNPSLTSGINNLTGFSIFLKPFSVSHRNG